MLSDYDLLKFLLPEFLVEHFDIIKAEEHSAELHIYFEEKSSISKEFKERLLESKGFLPEIIVDDYPLRGKIVKLHVKRRRWTDRSSGEILQRNWQVVAKGTRMTKEFACFLKKLADTKALPLKVIAEFFGIKGKTFQRQYKNNLSEYHSWGQKPHAQDWILYPENLSESLSLDEVALSDGELYSVLTSKIARGRKGSIVAIIKGTQSDVATEYLLKISRKLRMKVKEITLDMAGSMKRIAKRCFPNAVQVIDRFHVQKLAIDALQEIRIRHRWEAIEMENNAIEKASKEKTSLKIETFENGDSRKQLLARSRYLLYKSRSKWSESQRKRGDILFREYPDLEKAYQLADNLRKIYNQPITKYVAITKLAHWFKNVEEADFKSFSTLRKTIMNHYRDILNYFNQRSTNAAAESFNAKIKNFRMQLRGVKDRTFFLFRLAKLFA